MTHSRQLAVLLLVLLSLNSTASAAPLSSTAQATITQGLDIARSSIQVGLQSQLIQVDGKINDYSGSLVCAPDDFTRSQVRLEFDLSKAKLNARANGAAYPVDGLLSGMRVSKGVFQSTRIVDKGNSRYLISGLFVRGKSKRNVTIPIRLVSFNPGESRIEIAIDGPVDELDSDIALPQLFGPTQARVSGTLIFSAVSSAPTRQSKR